MRRGEFLLAVAVLLIGIAIMVAVVLGVILAPGTAERVVAMIVSPFAIFVACVYFFGGLTHLSCIVSDWQARRRIV